MNARVNQIIVVIILYATVYRSIKSFPNPTDKATHTEYPLLGINHFVLLIIPPLIFIRDWFTGFKCPANSSLHARCLIYGTYVNRSNMKGWSCRLKNF